MGKIAFVFAGQGAQKPGMGKELYDSSNAVREIFRLADNIRPGTSEQCFSGTKEELMLTRNTQPCLYCVDLAAGCALRESGIRADVSAGFSLGEVAALTFSGAFSMEDGFRFVCRRGELMQSAAEEFDSAMVAVLKLENDKVEDLCGKFENMYPVNYNCPGQLVVAGLKSDMDAFKACIKEAGGRALPLAVSGGFHSPFMSKAAYVLMNELQNIEEREPQIPVYANYTARPYSGDVRNITSKQVENPVLWQKTVENMIDDGVETFIECGPGRTLSGLITKISKNVSVYNVEDAKSLEETIKAVRGNA